LVVAGGSPASRSYLSVRTPTGEAGRVVLAALKPAGNPLATGRRPESTMDAVTVRLYETAGRRTPAELRLWAPVTGAVEVNLLDRPTTGTAVDPAALSMFGHAISQLRVGIAAAPVTGPDEEAAEPIQPVYARYWLHNSGPAPIGNLPVSAHLDPPHANADGPVTLALTVASDLIDDRAVGVVALTAPDGWKWPPSRTTWHRATISATTWWSLPRPAASPACTGSGPASNATVRPSRTSPGCWSAWMLRRPSR
jgi:alpha-mannosidase